MRYLIKSNSPTYWHPAVQGGTFNLMGMGRRSDEEVEADRIIRASQVGYPNGPIAYLMQRGSGESIEFAWVPMSSVFCRTPEGWQNVPQFERFDRG